MANYYIADLHLGHHNVIAYDDRPFNSVAEMDNALISLWNEAISKGDTVYILGDMIWGKAEVWPRYLEALKGNKVLIKGNHDLRTMPAEIKKYFKDVKEYKEIVDGDRRVIMSHYPIPFYEDDYSEDVVMLYGHVHNTREYAYLCELRMQIKNNYVPGTGRPIGNFINVGCMMPWMNYMPRTLDEIIMADEERNRLTPEKITAACEGIFRKYNVDYVDLIGRHVAGESTDGETVYLVVSGGVTGLNFFGMWEEIKRAIHKEVIITTPDNDKTKEEVEELTKYRLEKAKRNLEVVDCLLEDEFYNFAINRSYYAAFDAMRAVNARDGFDSSKHSGVIAHFNQNYVKTGLFDAETSKGIKRASTLRENLILGEKNELRSRSLHISVGRDPINDPIKLSDREEAVYDLLVKDGSYTRAELADKTVCNSTVIFTPQKVRLTRHQLRYMIHTSNIV